MATERRTSGGGSQAALREQNTTLMAAALTQRGPQLQADLARFTGLSRATVSNIVSSEVAAGGRFRTEKVLRDGRWGTLVSLAPADWVVAGIDVGRTHLRLACLDTGRRLLGEREVALERGHEPGPTFERARMLLDEVLADAGLHRDQVRRVGVAVPASISPDGAVVQQSVFREWSGLNLAEFAAQQLGVDVVVDNDANLGAYAHSDHAPAGGTLIYVKVASGIGAGLVMGDRVYHSTSGLVGELGHVQVVDGGQTCYCGSRGCLETLASAWSVRDDYARVNGQNATLDDVIAAGLANDPVTLNIIAEAGDALGRTLALVCNLLSPDTVVLGGPLVPLGEPLIAALVAAVRKGSLPNAVRGTAFVASDLEPRAVVLGACFAALRPPAGAISGQTTERKQP